MQVTYQDKIVKRARECVGAMWGRDEGQFDAWGLVAHVLGRPLELERRGWGPECHKATNAALRDMGLRLVASRDARPGDVALFLMDRMGEVPGGFHVAILTDTSGVECQAVQATYGRAVAESWIGHLIGSRRFMGIYRPTEPAAMGVDLAEAA